MFTVTVTNDYHKNRVLLNGCGNGSTACSCFPCFRENVVVTCKIGSFLCSLDNLLQKNVNCFLFENHISKWRSFEKRVIFDLLFTFFSFQGKLTKIPSAHISLTYIHVFCSPYWQFLSYQFWKKKKNRIYISGVMGGRFSFAPFMLSFYFNPFYFAKMVSISKEMYFF